jgi:hypothetical protein
MNQLGGTVAGVLAAASVTMVMPQGDLRLFFGAEAARDSLAAPRLADAMFRRIPDEWPASPYAPKAILAAQQLDSTWTDSARTLLEERYRDSPYLALVRGEATPAYRQLEDSLSAFAATLSPPTEPAQPGRRAAPPRDDRDQPGRRRQPGQRPQPAPTPRVFQP